MIPFVGSPHSLPIPFPFTIQAFQDASTRTRSHYRQLDCDDDGYPSGLVRSLSGREDRTLERAGHRKTGSVDGSSNVEGTPTLM